MKSEEITKKVNLRICETPPSQLDQGLVSIKNTCEKSCSVFDTDRDVSHALNHGKCRTRRMLDFEVSLIVNVKKTTVFYGSRRFVVDDGKGEITERKRERERERERERAHANN